MLLFLRYLGNDNRYHNVFIDSGYERTFRFVLEDEINRIQNNEEKIDLWIISHIHDDHIGGAIKYLDVIQNGELTDIVNEWLYNPPRISRTDNTKRKFETSEAMSIHQGDLLYQYLIQNSKLSNIEITNKLLPIDLLGLKMTILSPSPTKLAALRNKYFNDSVWESIEGEDVSTAKASLGNDYHIPIISFDLSLWKEDKSVENGSSISILTELKDKKILWLADSHPSDIVEQLVKMGFSTENQITCDFVKVSHHGSNGNNSSGLFNLIDCQNYIFSVNGENIYNLPMKECISRILRSSMRNINTHYNLYFTYDNKTLRDIFICDGKEIYNELNFTVHYLAAEKYLHFDLL
ncbi:MAG: MBL fold metallo-hydrolase [Bacteroidetes bacterium]|nr:MBL fold metallo-hydrolase [Bacteroidota bacterium]